MKEDTKFTELDTLHGVDPAAKRKLREAGIPCVEVLSILTMEELEGRTRLGEETSRKLLRNAREMLGIGKVDTGHDREQELLRRRRLTTGLSKLDEPLKGGFETGSVVELYGASQSGKSQWCHQLAVTSILPEERKGLNGNVLWLDTESSFRPYTIRANALRWGLDPDGVLERIKVITVVNRDQLYEVVKDLPRHVVEQDCSLIVIDNIGRFFRLEIEPISYYRTLSGTLLRIFETLWGVAMMLDCVVVFTNQVYHDFSPYGYNRFAQVGAPLMSHMPTHRLFLGRGQKGKRKVALKYHAGTPEFSLEAHLGWGGFFDERQEKLVIERVIQDYLYSLTHSSPREEALAGEGAG